MEFYYIWKKKAKFGSEVPRKKLRRDQREVEEAGEKVQKLHSTSQGDLNCLKEPFGPQTAACWGHPLTKPLISLPLLVLIDQIPPIWPQIQPRTHWRYPQGAKEGFGAPKMSISGGKRRVEAGSWRRLAAW